MKRILVSTLTLLLLGSGCLRAEGVTKAIQFQKGKTSATVSATVVRGDTDRYTIVAEQDQTMTVALTSKEKNAALTIYAPGYSVTQEDGVSIIAGETLAGAGEGEDAAGWSGILPTSGKYLIDVGGTRGNASYKMTVTIQ